MEVSMACFTSFLARRAGSIGAVAAVVLYLVAGAEAQSADDAVKAGRESVVGRIDFEAADLPAANVEIDLTQSMFGDLFGLGDAAIAGVAEALLGSGDARGNGESTRLAAEQLQSAQQIMRLASDVVREVRVRVYQDFSIDSDEGKSPFVIFDRQLEENDWETLVRVRNDDENVRVSLLRDEGAVRGLFVVAANGGELVLANIVCDVSPENVKKLTSAATKIGLDNGLSQVIEMKMKELHHSMPPRAGSPPEPPKSKSK
jgi:hypothetical protein